jgi:crotonobetainyl-CoA:carnitine CoA-transferase CaiB-like acyl-CoA transferase
VSISGFGPDGPYANQPAYDTVIQGLTGFMQIQGEADDPRLVRGIAADKTTGLTAAYAAMAALFARERNGGRGQHVEVPMLDAYAAFALSDSLGAEAFLPVEDPPPGAIRMQDIHRTWQTADGHVVMMIIEDSQFKGLCQAIDREDFLADPRCANLITRIANATELFAQLEEEIAKWSTSELLARARKFGAPIAPANGIKEFLADPQVKANRTVFELEHEQAGTLRQLRNPARFSATPTSVRRTPPGQGEHSDEVLRELGYDEAEVRALRGGGSVS